MLRFTVQANLSKYVWRGAFSWQPTATEQIWRVKSAAAKCVILSHIIRTSWIECWSAYNSKLLRNDCWHLTGVRAKIKKNPLHFFVKLKNSNFKLLINTCRQVWEQKFPGEPWNLEARKHGGQQAEHQNGEFALIVQQSSAWEKPIGNYCYNARLFFLRHEGRIQNRKWEYEREKEKENTRKWMV